MKYVDPAEFGLQLKTKLSKSGEKDVERFADEVMRRVIWQPGASNEPVSGAPVAQINMRGPADKSAAADLISVGGGAGAGSIILYIAGETHRTGDDDRRASGMIQRLNGDPSPESCLCVEERGLKRKSLTLGYTNFLYASENDICGQYFSETQRSVAVAAYVALCVGGGDQSQINKALITFGENHIDDIVKAFEYICQNSLALTSLKHRPRVYYVLKSQG